MARAFGRFRHHPVTLHEQRAFGILPFQHGKSRHDVLFEQGFHLPIEFGSCTLRYACDVCAMSDGFATP